MTIASVELGRVIRVHYGAALKEAERDTSGKYAVFGSSGPIGTHSQALFTYPSIVVGRKGSAGSITYAPSGGWAIDTAFFIERISPDECDLRYLYHALTWADLGRHRIVTSIPGLSRDDIYRTRIPLPARSEQRRIADMLDKADDIRRKRREAIALTDDLLRSTFLDMFGDPVTNPMGWPVMALGDVVAEFQYGTSVKCSSSRTPKSVPVLRIPNVARGRIDWSDLKFAELHHEALSRLELSPGDILLVRSNGNPDLIGRCAVVESGERAAFASYLIRARVKAGADVARYLCSAMSQRSYREILTRSARTTAGNFNISVESLKRLTVPLPRESAIRSFLTVAARIWAIAMRLAPATDESAMLFETLSHHCFSEVSALW